MVKVLLPKGSFNKLNLVFIFVIFMIGCAPTYPKEGLGEAIKSICEKEYDIEVQAKLIGKTIVVFLPLDKLFDKNLDILAAPVEKIEDVILTTSRVIFSTDADIDFYMIIAADTQTTAAELVLIRYVEDVYKFMHIWIKREEYRKRVLWQINFNPRHLKNSSFDFDVEEITLPVYLARQIAQRLNFVRESSKTFKGKVKGVYQKENKQFYFSLVVADERKFENIHVPLILHEAAMVLKSYKIDDFEQVEVVNLFTKKSVIVKREELSEYLNIDIGELNPTKDASSL